MRKTLGHWRVNAAWSTALAVLVCATQISWGEGDTARRNPPAGVASQPEPPASFEGGPADDAFDQYVSFKRLGTAWAEMDSSALTDSALQFAEGERILLRSHHAITASTVYDLAIRLASENRDKESLTRIAKALEAKGDKERLTQVNLALKTAGAARAVDPSLSEGSAEVQNTIKSIQKAIQSAVVAGSKPQLDSLEKALTDAPISDKQRATLKKTIAEAIATLGTDKNSQIAVEQLDKLSGVIRPVGEVKEPVGAKFNLPALDSQLTIEEQLELCSKSLENVKTLDAPTPHGAEPATGDMTKLLKPSRSGGWTDQYPFNSSNFAYNAYGVGSIFQYCNANTKYVNANCGQAAVATMLSYHKCAYMYNDDSLQKLLEREWSYNPDMPLGAGTTPSRVITIANAFGLNTSIQGGYETNLKSWVGAGYPCICLMDVGKAGWRKANGQPLWGLHYTVVYAHNSGYYWCTNWQGSSKVPRQTFTNSWVRPAGMDFLLTWPKPNSKYKY